MLSVVCFVAPKQKLPMFTSFFGYNNFFFWLHLRLQVEVECRVIEKKMGSTSKYAQGCANKNSKLLRGRERCRGQMLFLVGCRKFEILNFFFSMLKLLIAHYFSDHYIHTTDGISTQVYFNFLPISLYLLHHIFFPFLYLLFFFFHPNPFNFIYATLIFLISHTIR